MKEGGRHCRREADMGGGRQTLEEGGRHGRREADIGEGRQTLEEGALGEGRRPTKSKHNYLRTYVRTHEHAHMHTYVCTLYTEV